MNQVIASRESDPGAHTMEEEDLTSLLFDGDFNVVYADDAIIHSACLQINGSHNPPQQNVDEPGTVILLIAGIFLLICIVIIRNSNRKNCFNIG